MPPAGSDVVRELWQRYQSHGVDAALELLDDGVVVQAHLSAGRIVRGRERVRALFIELERNGATLAGELEDVEDHDRAVVARGRLRIAGRDGVDEVSLHWVYHLHNGRIRRVSTHRSRADALAALTAVRAADLGFAVNATQDGDGERVVAPTGELDIATAATLERALAEAGRPGARVLLDLSGLEFLDSTGLRIVVRAAQAARASGWELRVRPGPPAVQRIFDLSGLGAAVPFERD